MSIVVPDIENTPDASPRGFKTVGEVVVLDPKTGKAVTQGSTGAGAVTADTQRVTLASDGPGVANLAAIASGVGAPADAAASTDTGTFSLLAFAKRAMQNWTTLLARVPALVSGAQPVIATPRTCLGTFRLSVTSTAATLPALVMAVGGAGIPAGAVVCELQADGGTVRLSRDNAVTPTTTTGYRLDDGATLNVDSTLSHVRLIAAATTPVNCTFFDRV